MNYGLLGRTLGHSFSPQIHQAFGRYPYELISLAPAELAPFFRARSFSGLNVTLPYKQAVIPYLDRLDPQAAAIGAVNTVVNRNGLLYGYNTDFGGMQAMLRRAGIDPTGKKALIFGSGGTARTAAAVLRAYGAAYHVVSRTPTGAQCAYADALTLHRDAQLLVNTTPVGMAPDPDGLPIDPADFPKLEALADVIYNPLRTRLCLSAGPQCRTANGLFMLVRQAALACALFTGAQVPAAQEEAIYRSLIRQQENIVLIGMPGAGKTTVGRLLAAQTGRPFLDADEVLEAQLGSSIRAYLTAAGEPAFRALEADLLAALSQRQGCVIATGGGAILREENVRRLRQNGRLFLLDRPLSLLQASADRPLADTAEKLRQLYRTRYPLYADAADCVIDNSGLPAAAAESILHLWKESL